MVESKEILFEENGAKVYEARYRTIKEPINPPSLRDSAKTMSSFEIKRGLRGTWPKVPLILAGFIVFIFVTQITAFLNADASTFWNGDEVVDDIPTGVKGAISILITPMDGPGAIMIIHIAVISAGLISGDLRDRAIDLYYSKISVRSYFLAKIIASIVLTFIGMPLFAIIYFLIALYKRLPLIENYQDELFAFGEILWKMSLTIILVTIFLSILVLVFSAYTTSPVNAGVGFLVFTLVSRVFFEAILYEATNIDLFYALSPISAVDVIRRAILAPDDISNQFIELSIITYSMYIIVSLALVWFKLVQERNN